MTRPNVKRNESDKTETRWTKKKARIRRRREIEEEDREERMEAVREKKQKRSSNRFFVSAARSLETEQLATTQSPPSLLPLLSFFNFENPVSPEIHRAIRASFE